MNLFVGRAQLHPFPAVPRLAAAHGGGGAGGLAALRAQGPGLQGGAGQPHLQVVETITVTILSVRYLFSQFIVS